MYGFLDTIKRRLANIHPLVVRKTAYGNIRVASLVSLKPNTSNLVLFESVWFRIFGLVLLVLVVATSNNCIVSIVT